MPAMTGDAGLEEAAKVRFVRRRAHAVFAAHGYREILPSALEPVGQAARLADVALALQDGRELRNDALAALARVYAAGPDAGRFARRMMAGALFDARPLGPLKRTTYEVEAGAIFGVPGAAADAEVCALALALADDPGLDQAEVLVSTLGDEGDVERYLGAISELMGLQCDACHGAVDRLRFFSCDEEGCRALAATAPALRDYVSPAARAHHEALLACLQAAGVTRVRDEPRLAFGAARYRRTIVELRARAASGARVAAARGGRRDGLVAALGGRAAPLVGLTIGLLRAAACVAPADASFEPACEIFIAAQGASARAWAFHAAAAERARGFRVDVDLGEDGWDEQLRRAGELHARVVVLCGEDERAAGVVQVRNSATGELRRVAEEELPGIIKRLLR
jgi:histidyl-tRNA synthetase